MQDEPSDYLILNLGMKVCREVFDLHCEKSQLKVIRFKLSENLKTDLAINLLAREKRDCSAHILAESGLGVLNTTPPSDNKRRKLTQNPAEESLIKEVPSSNVSSNYNQVGPY